MRANDGRKENAMTRTVLTVEGMSCPSCIEQVRNALALDGVASVDVQLEDGTVRVDHAPGINAAQLTAALGAAGYEAREGAAAKASSCQCCA
jgi:copper chaperone CopZ